jgi:hypothetical protein
LTSPQETIESQKAKLLAYEEALSTILSEQFDLPLEEDLPAPDTLQPEVERDPQPLSGENGAPGAGNNTNTSTTSDTISNSNASNGGEAPKRRGRSRSRSGGDRGDSRRNKTGGSYLDLFDIVNMTYEEYLEAYRSVSPTPPYPLLLSLLSPFTFFPLPPLCCSCALSADCFKCEHMKSF